ncbi:hypothetical protein F5Y08DRAFT_355671 [Xylaria arbuscula]|nr:hypothetical protein F5Y08DRAFT_355671 [Xylaria arbuscula]
MSIFTPAFQSMHLFKDELLIEVIVGDMMEVLERIRYDRFLRPNPTLPKKYHVIHMSNIPAEYLLMQDQGWIQKHFAVKLSSLTPESGIHSLFSMFPLLDYKMWESVGRRELVLAERLPREKLFFWLYSIFFKICLPFPRSIPDFSLVYAPLNMTAFMRMLDLVAELGYPPHWICIIVCAIASGEINTTAKICVRPWADEFTSLAAMWRGVWPDGTLVLTRNLLPPLSGISEHSIQFTDFTADNLSYPHFALVFWNQRKYGDPPRNLRPVLLDDEKGDTTSSACAIRANGVKVLSTFS